MNDADAKMLLAVRDTLRQIEGERDAIDIMLRNLRMQRRVAGARLEAARKEYFKLKREFGVTIHDGEPGDTRSKYCDRRGAGP